MPKPASTTSTTIARRAAKQFPATVVQELEAIEASLGGRQEIVGMLVLAPLTPDLRYLLGLLGDPRSATQSLAEICTLANVLPGALLKHLGEAALLRGKVLASQQIGLGIAAVTGDVMRRAAPYEEVCNAGCQGTGTITPDPSAAQPNPVPTPCETCLGTGRLRYQPDLERQKLAIEMANLLPKSGGINIAQINAPAAGGTGEGALEKIQQLSDQILYGASGGGAAAVDGELTEVGDADDPAEPTP